MNIMTEYLMELILSQIEKRGPKELPDGIQIEEIVAIAFENQIELLVINALSNLDEFQEFKNKFQGIAIQRLIMSATQMNELRSLQQEFEEKSIKNHPMKGSILKDYYPSQELRQMSDLDILVEDEDMPKVREILEKKGYEFIKRESHHDIFKKPPYMYIEIHRSLYDGNIDKYQYDYFGSFDRSILVDGFKYKYQFSHNDFYVYMMAHMAKHFYQMGCGVRNLIDIYVFREKFNEILDREYIENELKHNGILVFSQHIEKLTCLWFGEESLPAFYNDLLEYMLGSGIYGKDENGIWNKYSKETIADGKTSKLKLKIWYYFPPLYYMKDYYPWLESNKWLLPIAWTIRGLAGLIKHKGIHKRELLNSLDGNEIGTIQRIYREMELDFHLK